MAIVGIILLVVGVILFFIQRYQKQKFFSIKAARKITAAELVDTARGVAAEIGGGSWRDYVKVWGRVEVDMPLISEHTRQKCVYYQAKVMREYEEQVTERDSQGRKHTKTVRKSDTVSNNKQSVPFRLVDDTGAVQVNPEGADVELVQVMDEFRAEQRGFFSLSRTLGHRYQESLLPLNRNILVVGAASDVTGQVTLGKPTTPGYKYLISLKDEEALAAMVDRHVKTTFYAMVGCLGVGVVLTLLGLISG